MFQALGKQTYNFIISKHKSYGYKKEHVAIEFESGKFKDNDMPTFKDFSDVKYLVDGNVLVLIWSNKQRTLSILDYTLITRYVV